MLLVEDYVAARVVGLVHVDVDVGARAARVAARLMLMVAPVLLLQLLRWRNRAVTMIMFLHHLHL
jgi:hypothetical protein